MNRKKQNDFYRKALLTGGVMLSSWIMKQGIEAAYKQISGHKAPKNPGNRSTEWTSAIIYSMVTGAVLGSAKTFLRAQITRKLLK